MFDGLSIGQRLHCVSRRRLCRPTRLLGMGRDDLEIHMNDAKDG
jgi:hypothetical protein